MPPFPQGEAQALCLAFFAAHDVFRADEFRAYLAQHGVRGARTWLRHYGQERQLWPIRPGLYASVRPRRTPAKTSWKPLSYPPGVPEWAPAVRARLVASKIAKDAVLSHHTALESHGCAHNVWFHIIYTARHPCPPVRLRGALVRGTRTPASLLAQGAMQYETQMVDAFKQRITTIERTLVDILDRPYLCGGWDEIGWAYANAAGIDEVCLPRVIDYALRLAHPFTCVKVGYFLELYQDDFNLDHSLLEPLRAFRPIRARALDSAACERAAFVALDPAWNLRVPLAVRNRTWEEY